VDKGSFRKAMPLLASPKAKKKSKHDREIEIERATDPFDVRGDFLALLK